ncbi:MAG: response regulator [Phycisphaerae bacterium]|nr:response regulator [Phycisphaerae bacterium]
MAHVLVIDGEETSRRQLRSVLEQAGHQVSDASDGQAGVRQCGTNQPDVLVTDMITPEPEGLEFISNIRKTFSDTGVVAISEDKSCTMGHLLNIARHFGVNRSLCKPIDHSELLRVVDKLVADGRIELPQKIAC